VSGTPLPSTLTLPELGPLLGALVAAPVELPAGRAVLEEARVELLSRLFEKAGTARAALAKGDETAARKALGPSSWLEAWERAVATAARSLGQEIERRLRHAAAESRYPRRKMAALLPGAEERRILTARLSAAGMGLEDAVPLLDNPARAWEESLRRVAGELEAAWDLLVASALRELEPWDRRAMEIRMWRRSWLPLVIAGGLGLALAVWLGLVLGGIIPAPGWLRPLTDWVWNL